MVKGESILEQMNKEQGILNDEVRKFSIFNVHIDNYQDNIQLLAH